MVEELGSPDQCKGSFPAARMGNLAVVEQLDRLLQAICQSLVDRDFRYRAESHCSIFAILLGRIPGDRYRSVSAHQPLPGAGGPADDPKRTVEGKSLPVRGDFLVDHVLKTTKRNK